MKDIPSEILKFQKELKSFIFRLVTNRQVTEDILQETNLKVLENQNKYRLDKASIKTWVFTIALNTARNYLSRQKRWGENDLTVCEKYHRSKPERFNAATAVFYDSPEAKFEMKEHIDYCFGCISKTLVLPQQVCLMLKEIYGFKLKEIMKITRLPEGKTKHAIADARKNMKRIFKSRCALINKNGVCNQCTMLNGIFNPEQDAHAKATSLKLSQSEQSQEKLLNIRLALVKGIDPLNGSSPLHIYWSENLEKWVEKAQSENLS